MRANLVEEGALLDLQLVEARHARVRSQLLHLPILAAVFALRFSDFFSFCLGRQVFLAFFFGCGYGDSSSARPCRCFRVSRWDFYGAWLMVQGAAR